MKRTKENDTLVSNVLTFNGALRLQLQLYMGNNREYTGNNAQPPRRANTRGILVGGVDRASYDVPTADVHTNLINDTLKWAGQALS
uniref:Uncharacterized protein n=1 Tax=Timema poppense TaxID=170557 RepID=A0A7R9H3A7_TIMPO|nr:unnamed protein product [Timema poppensis]